MSWLKLNDSLNKVKGSITSFTQEVFADGIIDEDSSDQNPVRELNVARGKIDELTELCVTQDQELITFAATEGQTAHICGVRKTVTYMHPADECHLKE
ncbi:hypothetical protein ZHAS_00005495 [Anopheles sinensis]|uniref:Uncharacterized protein n=1 Tax=Anopheles sinensis TaxID=74873 RepID=A0A084VJP0_ANOSI|nr:hypothetical protein ZHAS_00005495 [Anopheles sinensis]